MSSSNSIFSSETSEERWLNEMFDYFPPDRALDVFFDFPPCVFRVPRSQTETKPEAYAPQQVGLGAYHHLRPDLYKMQRRKIAAVMKFLNAEQRQNFQLLSVAEFMKLNGIIRGTYDQYLDLAPATLAWILAIDATYLLQFFAKYRGESGLEATERAEMEKLARDILMLENQIPALFLVQAHQQIERVPPQESLSHVLREATFFCIEVSPLKLNLTQLSYSFGGHLLSLMYHSIVSDQGHYEHMILYHPAGPGAVADVAADVAADLGVPGVQVLRQALSYVPWDKILDLFKRGDPDRKESSLVEEIRIPSVSQLTEIAGIAFACTEGGIRDVKFDEGEKKFYLPVITLKSSSEVVLRNLLAYEAATAKPGSTLELAEYVDLMCGIVDTPKDVEILRNAEIIKGDLKDEEIATIFNGIRKSTGDKDEKTTGIEKAVDKVNVQYATIWRVKVYRSVKRYIPSLRKFVTVLLVMGLLALFGVQIFCEIHGCKKR